MQQSTSSKHLHFSLLGRGNAGLWLVLEDELSGPASVYSPELFQENDSFFFFCWCKCAQEGFCQPKNVIRGGSKGNLHP